MIVLHTLSQFFSILGEGPLTVFAPSNEAFGKLADRGVDLGGLDDKALTFVLAYHVTDASLPSDEIESGFFIALNGDGVYIEKFAETGNIVVNSNSDVETGDIIASNGVIHIVDEVLLPPIHDVVGIAVNGEGFSILVELLTAANLVEVLQAPAGPYTVFAPNDEAFMKLGQATLDALKNDIPSLTNILLYHVTTGYVGSGELIGGDDIETLAEGGAVIRVRPSGKILNDNTRFLETDLIATNGAVHVIDSVLIPPALADPE